MLLLLLLLRMIMMMMNMRTMIHTFQIVCFFFFSFPSTGMASKIVCFPTLLLVFVYYSATVSGQGGPSSMCNAIEHRFLALGCASKPEQLLTVFRCNSLARLLTLFSCALREYTVIFYCRSHYFRQLETTHCQVNGIETPTNI